MKNTITTFKTAKENGEKLTMLTCYDYSMAKLMDESGINALLVGDSMGTVIMGYENTLPVTIDDIIHHTACVSRGAKNAIVIADMPFMSYHTSIYDGVVNAGRLIKEGGANAIKLEGGACVIPVIDAIINAQIPVCGHLGLTPQSINAFGGFKIQGKSEDTARQLIEDALLLEKSGCFAIVLEGIPYKLAKIVTEKLSIPTIGIGAGAYCDGQVLVYQDMLGIFSDFSPKFVKQFADCGNLMKSAFKMYIHEVNTGAFPSLEHSYKINDDIIDKLY